VPVYCYRNEAGELWEEFSTIAEMESKIDENFSFVDDNGVKWTRDFAVEMGVRKNGCAAWPMKSDAAGVHPSQAQEAYETSRKMGIPTRFDPSTGQAIFESRGHRKQYLKAHGLHDRNGGYGD
tara:strand:- start:2079 stop:2447 length:369 start_codon:yes stop_codon:yes gene_type:complete